MKNLLHFQECLAKRWKYKKLRKQLSIDVRNIYENNIPIEVLEMNSNCKVEIKTHSGTTIASKYNRIVIGDYGAFIEIEKDDMILDLIKCKKGQEYRYKDPKYTSVKYWWLTCKDDSDIKIYYQQNKVTYADYLPNKFYISPYEVTVIFNRKEKSSEN